MEASKLRPSGSVEPVVSRLPAPDALGLPRFSAKPLLDLDSSPCPIRTMSNSSLGGFLKLTPRLAI
jgi:hypothetical protein